MQVLSIPRKKRVKAIAFSPAGTHLAAAYGDDHLRLWDIAAGTVTHAVPLQHTSADFDLTYLDDRRLAFAGAKLECWDVVANTWEDIASDMRWMRRVCVSPDGRCLADADVTTSADWQGPGLVVRETAGWRPLPEIDDALLTTGGMAFSPDGRWLATGHITLRGHRQRYLNLVPGGFATPEYEYEVRVREMPTGKVVRTLGGWQQGVSHLAFSPDGTFLAGTAGPRLRVWDVAAEREVAVHKRGTKHFQGVAFTTSGRYLATVSNDETVRVWDAETWQEHTTITWEAGRLLNLAFAPDGLRLAAGTDQGKVVIWDWDIEG